MKESTTQLVRCTDNNYIYRLYGFVACPDGMTYGVCYPGGDVDIGGREDELQSFKLIPYTKLKPYMNI